MWDIAFIISMWVYWFSEGCTEGYTFASSKRRKENKLICGRIGEGVAKVDYHAWRLGENIGMVGAIAFAFLSLSEPLNFAMILAGSWLTGTWIYERALNYVFCGKVWDESKTEYHLLGWVIKRSKFKENLLYGGIGTALIVTGFCCG